MHLREERHRGRAPLWAAPPLRETNRPAVRARDWAVCLTSSPMLTTARASMAVSSGSGAAGGDNTQGGQPHRTFILRGREPIPRCCDRHPIYRWRTEWNAGRPVGQTSQITREPDRMFAAWGVRGPWGRARRRGSYSNSQISQSVSWRSSARAREISTGGGRGCQSFHKGNLEIAAKSCSYAHNRRMSHPRTQLQRVGGPDTEDNDRVRHPQTGNDRNQKHTDETASWKDAIVRDLLFRICSLSLKCPGESLMRETAPLRQPGTKQRWTALWRSALFSSTRLRSKNLMSGCICRPFIPVCTGSGSGMQNPLANFIGVFS